MINGNGGCSFVAAHSLTVTTCDWSVNTGASAVIGRCVLVLTVVKRRLDNYRLCGPVIGQLIQVLVL